MGRRRQYSTEQVLQVLRDRDRETDPVLSSVEIADRLGTTRQTVGKRLDELTEEERVVSASYGQMSVWWPADESMRPDEDSVDADQVRAEERNRWANKLERPAAISLFVLIPSSFIFSVLILYSLASPAFDPGGVIGLILILTIFGSIASGVLVPLYWIFDSGLHRVGKADSEENSDTVLESETDDEPADTQEPTTA